MTTLLNWIRQYFRRPAPAYVRVRANYPRRPR